MNTRRERSQGFFSLLSSESLPPYHGYSIALSKMKKIQRVRPREPPVEIHIKYSIRQKQKLKKWYEKAPDNLGFLVLFESWWHQIQVLLPKMHSQVSSRRAMSLPMSIIISSRILSYLRIHFVFSSRLFVILPTNFDSFEFFRAFLDFLVMKCRQCSIFLTSTTINHRLSRGSNTRCFHLQPI